MPIRPVKWLMANQFQHARSFLAPSLEHECVPEALRQRVEFRIRTGKKLLLARILLAILLFVGVGVFYGIIDRYAGELSTPLLVLVSILALLVPVLAAPGILILTRSIRLLETDLFILAAEVVARCQAAGAPLPSEYEVGLRGAKKTSARRGPRKSDKTPSRKKGGRKAKPGPGRAAAARRLDQHAGGKG